MIDQASVFADRYKGNRQALQAAVLGQNSQIDSFTALRALQLLKESDAATMAQQAQGPTEQPSLMQEALQPPQPQGLAGMMPAGQPVPGQQPQGAQMGQAPMPQGQQPMPQQMASGGLAMMPVSDADYADGGIVSFATGNSVQGSKLERLKAMADQIDRQYQAAKKVGNAYAADKLIKEYHAIQEQISSTPPEAPAPVATVTPQDALNTAKQYGDNRSQQLLTQQVQAPEALPQQAPAPQALQAPESPDPQAFDASQFPMPQGGSADAAALNGPPPVLDPTKTGGGINRQPINLPPMPSMFDVNAYIGAANTFEPTKIEPYEPKSREAMIASAEQDGREALKNFFGTDKAAEKSQAILNKRLAELDDPENSKYDQAMAWFKGAAAMQEGSRPLKAMANAFGEVASGYSALKKEQRKARSLIEDSQMLLDRAKQAREDGFSTQALADEEKAEARRLEGHKLEVDIAAKQDQLRLQATGIATQAATSMYGHKVTGRGNEITATTQRDHNRLVAEANNLAKTDLSFSRIVAEINGAYRNWGIVQKDVATAIENDETLKRLKRDYGIYRDKDDSGLSKEQKTKRDRLKREIEQKEAAYNLQVLEARQQYQSIAKLIENRTGIGTGKGNSGTSKLPAGFIPD